MIAQASSVDQAKELLSVISPIWGVLTTVLLATAWRWSEEAEVFNVWRSYAAVAAALLAVLCGGVVVVAMTPLAYEVTFVNDGPMHGLLLIYQMMVLAVVGLTGFSVFVLVKATRHFLEVRGAR